MASRLPMLSATLISRPILLMLLLGRPLTRLCSVRVSNARLATPAQATIPSNLKIQAPLTMVIGLRYLGSSAVGVDMISLPLNNTAAPNYIAAGLRVYSAGNLGMITSTSSGNNNVSGITLTTGQDIIIVGVFGTTTYALYGFPVNGSPLPPITGTWATSPSATYTSTALLCLEGSRAMPATQALSCTSVVFTIVPCPQMKPLPWE